MAYYSVLTVDETGKEDVIFTSASPTEKFLFASARIEYEVNRAGSFTFSIYPEHRAYNTIQKLKTFIKVLDYSEVLFLGRVIDEQIDFYRAKTFTCEGILSTLNDVLVAPYDYSASGEQVWNVVVRMYNSYASLFDNPSNGRIIRLYTGEPFKTWSQNTKYYGKSDAYKGGLDLLLNDIMPSFNLYARVAYDRIYVNPAQLILYSEPEKIENNQIRFGFNLLDITRHIDATNIYTYLVPTGKDGLTIESVNSGNNYIYSSSAAAQFGKIYRHVEFSDIGNATDLKKAAQEELDKNIKESTHIELSAMDLTVMDYDMTRLEVGKLARVVSEPHGIDDYFLCSKITMDLIDPTQSTYSFGVLPERITDIV